MVEKKLDRKQKGEKTSKQKEHIKKYNVDSKEKKQEMLKNFNLH